MKTEKTHKGFNYTIEQLDDFPGFDGKRLYKIDIENEYEINFKAYNEDIVIKEAEKEIENNLVPNTKEYQEKLK